MNVDVFFTLMNYFPNSGKDLFLASPYTQVNGVADRTMIEDNVLFSRICIEVIK